MKLSSLGKRGEHIMPATCRARRSHHSSQFLQRSSRIWSCNCLLPLSGQERLKGSNRFELSKTSICLAFAFALLLLSLLVLRLPLLPLLRLHQ